MSKDRSIDRIGGYTPLVWRLGVAMAEANIRTNRELKKRLADTGYKTSEATLSRLRKVELRAIELDLLAALCAVLTTTPDELLAPMGGWPKRNERVAPSTPAAPRIESDRTDLRLDAAPVSEPRVPAASSMLGPRIKAVRSLREEGE